MRVPVSLRGAEAVVVAFLLILSAGGLVSAQAAASDSPTVRKAAVAGMFYPAAADDLRRVVETSLSEAKKEEFPGTIRAILAPHAGYVFCSRGLGAAYKQIEGPAFKYDTVILIGPSHRFATKASALSSVHVWETPLGPVQVASDLCREFARST
ncbi:MAG: AmmeMemoRadiSam system protein B, partial [Thermodesulfobacteriota bacterium]